MRRAPLLMTLLALVAVAVAWTLVPDARPLTPTDVQGAYLVKLNGESWIATRPTDGAASTKGKRVRGQAYLILGAENAQSNDGRVSVEVRLASNLEGSILDRLTNSPDFLGSGVLIGDRLSVIDSGSSVFTNALNLRFLKQGRKVEGGWVVAWPATALDATFSGGANVALKGKQIRVKAGQPGPQLPPLAADARAR